MAWWEGCWMLLKWNFLGQTFFAVDDDLKFIRNRNVPSIQGYLSETWWTQHHQEVTLKGISTKQDVCFSPFTSIDLGPPLVPIPPFYLRIGPIPRNESLMWWPIWLRWPWHKQMMVCLVVVAREWPWNVVELPCSMAFNGEGSWDWAPSRLQRIVSNSGTKKIGYNHYNHGFCGGWKRCEVGSLILLMIWCTKKWMTVESKSVFVYMWIWWEGIFWKPQYFQGKFPSLLV